MMEPEYVLRFLNISKRIKELLEIDTEKETFEVSLLHVNQSFSKMFEILAEMIELLQNAPENDFFEELRDQICNCIALLNFTGHMCNTFFSRDE